MFFFGPLDFVWSLPATQAYSIQIAHEKIDFHKKLIHKKTRKNPLALVKYSIAIFLNFI